MTHAGDTQGPRHPLPAAAAAVVAILGMHRSGTSVVAALLERMGVFFGDPAQHLPPLRENPRGFWEHAGIRDINEDLLLRLGGSWMAPPPFPAGWHLLPVFDDLRGRARTIITTEFSGREPWGWKDPRACVLLPFWAALLPSMHYVICVRHPFEVSRSLQERDGLTMADAQRLWLASMATALLHTADRPRCIVHYDEVMDAPATVAAALSSRLDVAHGTWSLAGVIEPGLRHHRASHSDASREPLTPHVSHLYAALCASDADHTPGLSALAQAILQAQAEHDAAANAHGWFVPFVQGRLQSADRMSPEFGRPIPVNPLRQRARAYLSTRPALGTAYRRVRRLVRTALRLDA